MRKCVFEGRKKEGKKERKWGRKERWLEMIKENRGWQHRHNVKGNEAGEVAEQINQEYGKGF